MFLGLQDLLEQVNVLNNSLIHQVDYSGFLLTASRDDDLDSFIPNRSQPPSIPPLSLQVPSASSFITRLESIGAPYAHAASLAAILVERSAELAERYSAIYTKTCEELQSLWRPSSLGSLSSLYNRIGRIQETYDLKVGSWADEMASSAMALYNNSSCVASQSSRPTPSKNSFNNDYVPILETFFAENMYPSRADRCHLAKRSGMELRQINVWFQNKRRRTRQTSQVPPTTLGRHAAIKPRVNRHSTPSSEHSTSRTNDAALSDSEETDVDDIEDDDLGRCSRSTSFTLVDEISDPFNYELPEYAFPATYPPLIDYEPFPCKHGDFSFFKIKWDRSPSLKPVDNEEVDVDSLTVALKELRIHGGDLHKQDPQGVKIAGKLATCMLTTTFPAPLPSFIPPTSQEVRFRGTQPSRIVDSRPARLTPSPSRPFISFRQTPFLPRKIYNPKSFRANQALPELSTVALSKLSESCSSWLNNINGASKVRFDLVGKYSLSASPKINHPHTTQFMPPQALVY